MLSEVIVILIGVASFVLFLVFHRRLACKQYNKQPKVLWFWSLIHTLFGITRFGGRIRGWIGGTDKDFEPIWMIVFFVVTGIIMTYLARRSEKWTISKR